MADAPKAPVESAIPAPEPVMTQWQARRRMGWMSTVDFLFMFVLLVTGTGTLLWCLLGWPSAVQLLGIGVATIIFLLLWVLLLLYRSMLFTLEVRADINMLPVEAARIAVAHITGLGRRQDEHAEAKK